MSEIPDLHVPFEDYLRAQKIPFVRSRADCESTIALGHPDFTLLANNRSLMIEFKTEKGALSDDQKKRIAELESAGNRVFVVRDIGVAIELAGEWIRQLAAPVPIVDKANDGLVIVGHGVFRKVDGRLTHVRVASEEDRVRIPPMKQRG